MANLSSFDIFDTCLVRRFAFPTDLFLCLAVVFEKNLEPLFGNEYPQAFRDYRVEAEARALKSTFGEETTLREIWTILSTMIPGIDIESGMKAELEAELNALTPIPFVLDKVQQSRRESGKVIFITDTYLPAGFIRSLLKKYGFLEDCDNCYVSSEIQKTKRTGTIFEHVISSEGIKPENLKHFGDNNQSDYYVPKKLGIQASLFACVGLQNTELSILSQTHAGNLQFASRLAAHMRYFRLCGINTESEIHRHYVATFLGPTLYLFALWLLGEAQRDGIKRLYFLSRDGYALWHVAKTLAPRFGDIDCRYLYVSRQSLFLPTVTDIKPEGIPGLKNSFEPMTLESLLGKLELDARSDGEGFKEWVNKKGKNYVLCNKKDWNKFWELLTNDILKNKLIDKIKKRRSTALEYFRQEGLHERIKLAIVDIGWLLTCQKSLRMLLQDEQCDDGIRGYYLGLHRNRLSPLESGLSKAMFFSEPGDREQLLAQPEVFKRVVVLEHLLSCAPHGTVHHYEAASGSTFVEPKCAEIEDNLIKTSRKLVEFAVEFSIEMTESLTVRCTNPADILNNLLRVSLGNPPPQWREIIGNIKVSQNQNNLDPVDIVQPLTLQEVLNALFPFRASKIRSSNRFRKYWLELSYASSSPTLIKVMRLRNASARSIRNIFKYLSDF